MANKYLGLSNLETMQQILLTLGTQPPPLWDAQHLNRVNDIMRCTVHIKRIWKNHIQQNGTSLSMCHDEYTRMTGFITLVIDHMRYIPDESHPGHMMSIQSVDDLMEQVLEMVLAIKVVKCGA